MITITMTVICVFFSITHIIIIISFQLEISTVQNAIIQLQWELIVSTFIQKQQSDHDDNQELS